MKKFLVGILISGLLGVLILSAEPLRSKSDLAQRFKIIKNFVNQHPDEVPVEIKIVINNKVFDESQIEEIPEIKKKDRIQIWSWGIGGLTTPENSYSELVVVINDVDTDTLKEALSDISSLKYKEMIHVWSRTWIEGEEHLLIINKIPVGEDLFGESSVHIEGSYGCDVTDYRGVENLKEAKKFLQYGKKLYKKGLKIFGIETSKKLEKYLKSMYPPGQWGGVSRIVLK